jgi:hypothetical protein
MTHEYDRAAVVTTAVLQIIRKALLAWLDGGQRNVANTRAEIQILLCDEFSDVARETRNEIRREDG